MLIANIFLIGLGGLSVFWTLIVRKFGTIGTRALWFDLICGYVLVIILAHGLYPDALLFRGVWIVMPLLYVTHLMATLGASGHVHRHCVGKPRFLGGGRKGEAIETVIGWAVFLVFYCTGYEIFAWFLLASILATVIRDVMIAFRDRQRSAQMQDAMWAQNYMMDNFVKHNKGRI